MEKYVIWYRLWLKSYVRKTSCWLQLLGMVLLLLVISSVSVPDSGNVTVGICYEGDGYAKQIAEELAEGDSIFTFRVYDGEEELYRDVTAGKAECGFLFPADFERKIKRGSLKESVVYIYTPLTAKGEVAGETVYAVLLRIYSDEILKNSEKEWYGDADADRTAELLRWNRFYQEGNQVFRLETEAVDAGAGKTSQEAQSQVYPVQGMLGLFIFLLMFLAYGRKFEAGRCAVEKALDRTERRIYGYMGCLAAGTLPALAGIGMILLIKGPEGLVGELLLLLLFLAVSGGWILAAGSLMHRSTSFLSCIVVMTAANLLICPVFVDGALYVPALKYVSCLFPLGIYLRMHGMFL